MAWYLPDNNPVFWFELRRLYRGRSLWLPAILYSLLLIGIIVFCSLRRPEEVQPGDPWDIFNIILLNGIPFFSIFLSPALTIGALSGEREQVMLESMLLTPITPEKVVIGKFFARVPHLLAIFILSLPIGFIHDPFHGYYVTGIDVNYFLIDGVFFSIAILTATLGLWASCQYRVIKTAIVYAYLYVATYLIYFVAMVSGRGLQTGLPAVIHICINIALILFLLNACITALERERQSWTGSD